MKFFHFHHFLHFAPIALAGITLPDTATCSLPFIEAMSVSAGALLQYHSLKKWPIVLFCISFLCCFPTF